MSKGAITESEPNQLLPGKAAVSLPVLLERTIAALTALEAEQIEALLGECGRVEVPRSASEQARSARARRVLEHLLGATGRQLQMLRRVSSPNGSPDGYYGDGYHGRGWPEAGRTQRLAANKLDAQVPRLPGTQAPGTYD